MKKKAYIQPEAEVIVINGGTVMGDEWWSVAVDPDQEIEDDDIGAKRGFFDNGEDLPSYSPWED